MSKTTDLDEQTTKLSEAKRTRKESSLTPGTKGWHLAQLEVGERYFYEIKGPEVLQRESAGIHAIFVRNKALKNRKFSMNGFTAVAAQHMGTVVYLIGVVRIS